MYYPAERHIDLFGLAPRKLMQRSSGFTLVEMVVTIAIIAILATVAIPSFSGVIAKMKAQSTASDLYMALVKARSEAIKRNANITFAIGSDGKSWKIYPTATVSKVVENHTVSNDVSLDAGSVVYNSSGRLTSTKSFGIAATTGSVTTKFCVTTSLSGLPKVKKSAC